MADFNLSIFIAFSYLLDPKGRPFVNVLFSRIKMEDFML